MAIHIILIYVFKYFLLILLVYLHTFDTNIFDKENSVRKYTVCKDRKTPAGYGFPLKTQP